MRVFVGGREVNLLPGMKVRHVLIQLGLLEGEREKVLVRDGWGNIVGLDGSLTDGDELFVQKEPTGEDQGKTQS